ncbi:MAG: hypothetical protein HWN68_18585 [Desulfobacterales bacterium]|nr:hypothetical protein [Desulfobacterales bacterium]
MDYQDLRAALLSKGETVEDRSRHHIFFFFEIEGKTYRATKISHSAQGQIDNNILSAVAHQMRLTTKELRQFVKCPLSREGWLDLWQTRGYGWML